VGLVVVPLDQQPVLLLAVHVCRHERPRSLQPLALQAHGELPVALLLEQLVGAVVPDLDAAPAVLTLRDLAVERRIGERVVLDVHREHFVAGLERHALGHGPGRERAVSFQPEVVVQPAGVVPLNHEDRLLAAFRAAERLRRLRRIPFFAVLVERHLEPRFFHRSALRGPEV